MHSELETAPMLAGRAHRPRSRRCAHPGFALRRAFYIIARDDPQIHLCVLLSASSSSDDFVKFGPSPSCRFERASDRALAKMASDRALKSVPSSPTCPLLYPSHWPARSKASAGAGFDPARVRGAAFTRAHTAGRRVRKACACALARRGGGKQQRPRHAWWASESGRPKPGSHDAGLLAETGLLGDAGRLSDKGTGAPVPGFRPRRLCRTLCGCRQRALT